VSTKAQGERPLRRDARRNRERIRKAASELFAERGVGVTLDDVAERAGVGVGVGTVYLRFPNKDALLDELFEEHIAQLVTRAQESLANPDSCKALIDFLEHLLAGFAANRALEHLVLHPDRGQQRLARARARLEEPVRTLVDRAKADGRLRADFEAADIRMIPTMLAAVLDDTQATSQDVWRRYFVIIVDGLASKRSAPTPTRVAAPPPFAPRRRRQPDSA
jgi:AcrR family transcriptional regulator